MIVVLLEQQLHAYDVLYLTSRISLGIVFDKQVLVHDITFLRVCFRMTKSEVDFIGGKMAFDECSPIK